mgnify:CR=1 FL=1
MKRDDPVKMELILDGIQKKFGEKEVLRGVSFPFEQGKIYGLLGRNGAGKTTTIGKLAKFYEEQGKSVMLAAGDTFRAAASEQLTIWAERSVLPSSNIRKAPMRQPSSSMPRLRPKPETSISS